METLSFWHAALTFYYCVFLTSSEWSRALTTFLHRCTDAVRNHGRAGLEDISSLREGVT